MEYLQPPTCHPCKQLPILAGIVPPHLWRDAATLNLARKALNDDSHLLHDVITRPSQQQRLKSCLPFSELTCQLLSAVPEGISKNEWVNSMWKSLWSASPPSMLHKFIDDPDDIPGEDLHRKEWTTLNRIRTGVRRYGLTMKKYGVREDPSCECGHNEQTADHIMYDCPKYHPPRGLSGLKNLDKETRAWLTSTELVS